MVCLEVGLLEDVGVHVCEAQLLLIPNSCLEVLGGQSDSCELVVHLVGGVVNHSDEFFGFSVFGFADGTLLVGVVAGTFAHLKVLGDFNASLREELLLYERLVAFATFFNGFVHAVHVVIGHELLGRA